MRIHVLCTDGSPLGVTLKDLWGEGNRGIGIGGSEYALLTMCEEWHKAGHEVVLFNNPVTPNGSPFEQRGNYEFETQAPRDVLIVFRSPNGQANVVTNCLKVWWSCDQFTIGNYQEFAGRVQKIVCISDFHADYFARTYGIGNATVIDLPVRVQDLIDAGDIKKVPNKVIFTSVPERGLHYLRGVWPLVQDRCPDVNLTITSDYRLWGVEERNAIHREAWTGMRNVSFLGAVMRKQLIVEQLEAQILAYPNIYDELFCISVAEAQCAGVYPVTSSVGALITTNMGTIIGGNPVYDDNFRMTFVNLLTDLLVRGDLTALQTYVQNLAINRFHPSNIVKQWDEKVFAGV